MNKGLEPTHPARIANDKGVFARQAGAKSAIGHYDEALSAFDLEAAPELAVDILIGRGLAYRILNDLAQAVVSYDQAIHLINQHYLGMRRVEVYLYRGCARGASGELELGRSDFYTLVDLAEVGQTYPAPIVNLLLQPDVEITLGDCNVLIESQPDFGRAIFCRGLLHYRRRDWDGALADFECAGQLALERDDERLASQLVGRERAIADRRRMESNEAKIAAIATPEGLRDGVEYCRLDWIGDGNYTQFHFFDRETSRTVDGRTVNVQSIRNQLEAEGWIPYAHQSHQQGASYYYEREKT